MSKNNEENKLALPEISSLTRIMRECEQPFYYVFKEEVGGASIITREIKKNIINRWMELTPNIKIERLDAYFFRLQQKYWESKPPWSQKQLTNKITSETIELQNNVLESSERITTKAKVYNELSKTIADVNKLSNQASAPTFIIQTNIDTNEMAKELNQMEVLDVETNEE